MAWPMAHSPRLSELKSSRKPTGGPGTIVTATSCAAIKPPGSRAVTVTVAVPAATPETDIVSHDTETAATRVFDDDAS